MKKDRQCKTRNDAAIVDGSLYFEDVFQCRVNSPEMTEILEEKHLKAIRVVSLSSNWHENVWVNFDTSVKQDINVEMTLRKEIRSGRVYWYAYRQKGGKLQKRYVGQSDLLNERRIVEIARNML